MNFGAAFDEMRRGERVARDGWIDVGTWLRYIDLYSDAEFRVQQIVDYTRATWLPFIVMRTIDGGLVPWSASQPDMLAEDWYTLAD